MSKKKKLTILLIAIVALIFPIRMTLRDGGTVVYNALTYKVIVWHELNLTYEDDYKTGVDFYIFPMNFKSVKYYSEIDKGEVERNFGVAKIVEEDTMCTGEEDIFYQDDNKTYYFQCQRSQYINVVFKDETTLKLKDAFAQGKISISDLNASAIDYEVRDSFEEGSQTELDNINNEYMPDIEE
jgi:hypothetical protein